MPSSRRDGIDKTVAPGVCGAIRGRRRKSSNPVVRDPSRAVQNPHDPDAHYADKGSKQWIGYKVHVVESVDPEQPAKVKAEPGEHFITEILTTEAAENEKTGLAEALKRQQATPRDQTRGDLRRRRLCDREHFGASRRQRHETTGTDPSRSPQRAVQRRWVYSRCREPAGGLSAGKNQHSMQPHQRQLHGKRVLPFRVG